MGLEEKAREYGISIEELTRKEYEIQKVLVQYMPYRPVELYQHIIYRILDEAYKKEEESK